MQNKAGLPVSYNLFSFTSVLCSDWSHEVFSLIPSTHRLGKKLNKLSSAENNCRIDSLEATEKMYLGSVFDFQKIWAKGH